MSGSSRVLDSTDREWLLSIGQAVFGPDGSLRIHKERFQDPSINFRNIDIGSTPSSSSNSALAVVPDIDSEFVEVPQDLESTATYRMLGFTEQMAETLFRKWMDLGEELQELRSFEEVALNHIEYSGIDADEEPVSEWRTVLSALGICEELQQAIIKPGFEDLALTQSAAWWVKEAIGMRWRGLVDAQKCSSIRGAALRAASRSPQVPASQRS